MKPRELGSMQVAGQKIKVHELSDLEPTLISRWAATIEDGTIVGGGWLGKKEMPDTVGVWVQVEDSHKRLGLGSLLLRIAIDQAIYYRKRTMTAEVSMGNEVALHLLDSEEFEKQEESNPGFVSMRRDLKWV